MVALDKINKNKKVLSVPHEYGIRKPKLVLLSINGIFVSVKLRIHLTNVGQNESEHVWENAHRRAFATAVPAFPLTFTCDKCTPIAYICSSLVWNFL